MSLLLEGGHTMVQISESGWSDSPVGIKSSYDNCGGWMHMMCAMKAYLEYGINLRPWGAVSVAATALARRSRLPDGTTELRHAILPLHE